MKKRARKAPPPDVLIHYVDDQGKVTSSAGFSGVPIVVYLPEPVEPEPLITFDADCITIHDPLFIGDPPE